MQTYEKAAMSVSPQAMGARG